MKSSLHRCAARNLGPHPVKTAARLGAPAAILGLGALYLHPLQAQIAPALPPEIQSQTAQSPGARVETMDVLPASKIARGLGFNLKFSNQWEFARAKAVGATQVRFQFDWPSVERTRGALKLTPAMARALDLCAQNGLEPLIVAAYAPLAKPIGELTLRADTPAGARSLPVSGAALSLLDPPACHVLLADGTQIVAEGRWAYYGALIESVDGTQNPTNFGNAGPNEAANGVPNNGRNGIPNDGRNGGGDVPNGGIEARNGTLNLAAKTDIALPAGAVLRVNQLLYPSVATPNGDDASLVAYGRYARFLAREIAARGLRGQVELWNEPPWIHDRWDARGGFYDAPPPGISAVSPNPGMLDQFLQGEAPPPGVSFVWGGSNKSGGRGLGARRGGVTAAQLSRVSADAIHPYGDAPETHAWNPAALRAGIRGDGAALVGTNLGSNFKVLRQNQLAAARRGDPSPAIIASEIGYRGGDETQRTRYDLRAFLISLALGVERVNFYKLADKPNKYGFIDEPTQAPLPVYRSFESLMATINALPKADATARFEVAAAPTIAAYRGSFPLTVIPIAAPGRWLMATYQRTFAAPPQKWDAVPSPAPASVQMRVPTGFRVQKVWNLNGGAALPFQTAPGAVNYAVSDDPVMVEMSAAP